MAAIFFRGAVRGFISWRFAPTVHHLIHTISSIGGHESHGARTPTSWPGSSSSITCASESSLGTSESSTRLIRGEMMERSLHYYLLAPVRREMLLLGKFIAGNGPLARAL